MGVISGDGKYNMEWAREIRYGTLKTTKQTIMQGSNPCMSNKVDHLKEIAKRNMSFSVQEREVKTVLHWFTSWSQYQIQDFMADLVNKAVPPDVESLFDSMKTLKVNDKPPSIFQCQMKLFSSWFDGWSDKEKDNFVRKIGEISPEFAKEFHTLVQARKEGNVAGMES